MIEGCMPIEQIGMDGVPKDKSAHMLCFLHGHLEQYYSEIEDQLKVNICEVKS